MPVTNGSHSTPDVANAALIVSPETFNITPNVKEEFLVRITNVSFVTVMFRLLTTNPLRYLVTPRKGVIKPNASISVTIMLNRNSLEDDELRGETDDFRVEYCVMGPHDVIEPHCANVPELIKKRKGEGRRQVHAKNFSCHFDPAAARKVAERAKAASPPATHATSNSANDAQSASPQRAEGPTPATKMNVRELEVNTLAEKNRRQMAQRKMSITKILIVAMLGMLMAVFGVRFFSA